MTNTIDPPKSQPTEHERLGSVANALNRLGAWLKVIGVKQMPHLVFDDWKDWMSVVDIIPVESLNMGQDPMLSGFAIELARKPANPAEQFVDQEIGA